VEGGVPEALIRDRRHIAEEGILVALINVRAQTGELVDDPQFILRGFEWQNEIQPELAREAVLQTLGKMSPAEISDWDNTREELTQVLRRFCRKHLSRRPMVIAVVTEV
jgi:ribonuclease J